VEIAGELVERPDERIIGPARPAVRDVARLGARRDGIRILGARRAKSDGLAFADFARPRRSFIGAGQMDERTRTVTDRRCRRDRGSARPETPGRKADRR
jgi:hypothetical protein